MPLREEQCSFLESGRVSSKSNNPAQAGRASLRNTWRVQDSASKQMISDTMSSVDGNLKRNYFLVKHL